MITNCVIFVELPFLTFYTLFFFTYNSDAYNMCMIRVCVSYNMCMYNSDAYNM